MAEYTLVIKTVGGNRRHVITGGRKSGLRSLAYVKIVNDVGLLTFELDDNHPAIPYLTLDSQVEVWRHDFINNISRYIDFYGFFRASERYAETDRSGKFVAYCPEQKHLLTRAIIAYPANTTNRTTFSSAYADVVAKTLVTYNATSSGTTGDGRIRNVDTWGSYVSVEADASVGGQHDFRCAQRPLLNTLQDLSRIGAGDFDLVKTGDRAWEFRWYDGQLGADRTSTVLFSLKFGNMRNPRLISGQLPEKTVAIVGGQGEESSRTFVARTGTNYDATTNSTEVFVPATQYETTSGLNSAGDTKLDELEAKAQLSFETIQVPASLYGKHYFLGDKITARFADTTVTKQIESVSVVYTGMGANNPESIQVGMKDI